MPNPHFIEFVLRNQGALPPLPLVHTTNGVAFGEILNSGTLSVRMCTVYKTHLCYLFYGKPTYQIRRGNEITTRLLGDAAVCFVLKPSSIRLFRVFAFDTGAFHGHRYDDFMPNGITIDDFEITPASLPNIASFVGAFFESNRKYYDGEISCTCEPSRLDHVSEVFIALATAHVVKRFDERSCSCEVQTETNIPINSDTIENIVMPHLLADEPAVMRACAQWGIKPILYRFRRAAPESRTEVICEKLGDFYERKGYF